MNLKPRPSMFASAAPRQRRRAFTMVEIALCLAVIGFALVAIIGVLPIGMQVQKSNREDTIVNQDGTYFLEAIRDGAQGLDHLTSCVERITLVYPNPADNMTFRPDPFQLNPNDKRLKSGREVIGLLSSPNATGSVQRVEAVVRALTGAAGEKGLADKAETAFKYLLTSEVVPFGAFDTNGLVPILTQTLQTNLHDVRLTLRYPLLPNDRPGGSKQIFRALVSGNLWLDTNAGLHFFTPGNFATP